MSKQNRLDLVIPELTRDRTLIEIIRCLQNTGGEFTHDQFSRKKQSSQYIVCLSQIARVQTLIDNAYSATMISDCIRPLHIFPNEITSMIASYGMYEDRANSLALVSWATAWAWIMPVPCKGCAVCCKNQLCSYDSNCYLSSSSRGMNLSASDIQQLASRGYVYQYSPHTPGEREYNIQFSLQELIEAANIVECK
jgi:hypothetical protein